MITIMLWYYHQKYILQSSQASDNLYNVYDPTRSWKDTGLYYIYY
jgi:hypothetical protein